MLEKEIREIENLEKRVESIQRLKIYRYKKEAWKNKGKRRKMRRKS